LLCLAPSLYPSSETKGTVTREGQEVELRGKGRHDPCVLPRAIPMVEAMVALVLVDHLMMQRAQCELFPNEAPRELQPNPMGTTAQREGGPAPKDVEEPAGPVSQRVDEE
jgi:chorismate synthase